MVYFKGLFQCLTCVSAVHVNCTLYLPGKGSKCELNINFFTISDVLLQLPFLLLLCLFQLVHRFLINCLIIKLEQEHSQVFSCDKQKQQSWYQTGVQWEPCVRVCSCNGWGGEVKRLKTSWYNLYLYKSKEQIKMNRWIDVMLWFTLMFAGLCEKFNMITG